MHKSFSVSDELSGIARSLSNQRWVSLSRVYGCTPLKFTVLLVPGIVTFVGISETISIYPRLAFLSGRFITSKRVGGVPTLD